MKGSGGAWKLLVSQTTPSSGLPDASRLGTGSAVFQVSSQDSCLLGLGFLSQVPQDGEVPWTAKLADLRDHKGQRRIHAIAL